MAEEQYVNRDQHRADMAELRGELKEEIAGVRQDVAVLAKAIEHLTQTVMSGFTDMRQAMSDLSTRFDWQMGDLSTRLDRQEASLRQEIRDVRTASQRQLWVLIGVVIVTMVGGMIKVVFVS
jgi:predicted amino acid-binding ACT domain protein